MKRLRVLVLDSLVILDTVALEREGFALEVTSLEYEEIFNAHGYKVCDSGSALAHEGRNFDLIVIGNNLGTGLQYARVVPVEMRRRTLIVWNEYTPGDERGYARMGYRKFASRKDQTDWLIRMAQRTVAAQPLHKGT